VLLLRGDMPGFGELSLWSRSAGTVTGWEGVVAGWMVLGRPVVPRVAAGAVR
jgi:hypothetical protein